ncbi:hypothetical protein ACFLRU_02925 [Bacteroidota bacterium]
MKNILFVLIALFTVNIFAQRPGGGARQQNRNFQSEQPQKIKKFKASDAAGIFYYDVEKVIKKIKIKDENKQLRIKKGLRNYNSKIREISFLNSEKFEELDLVVSASEKNSDIRKKIGAVIRPVREEIRINEKELNRIFEDVLSEKQQKKWLKYQKKKSLQPKKPQNRENQNSRPTRGGGVGRGMRQ